MNDNKPLDSELDKIDSWVVDSPSIIGLGIQFGIMLSVSIIYILFFEFARKRKWGKQVYFTRCAILPQNTPEYKESLIELIKVIINTSEKWIIDNVGLDAVMFLRMFKLGIVVFSFAAITIAPILLPINFYAQIPDLDSVDNSTIPFLSTGLKRFSIANIPNKSKLHLIYVFFVYLFSIFIMYKLYTYYLEYLRYYYEYKKEENLLSQERRKGELKQFRTIFVQEIPHRYRTDSALKQWFVSQNIGEVENAVIIRRYDDYILKVSEKRDMALKNLENSYIKWIKNVEEYDRRSKRNTNNIRNRKKSDQQQQKRSLNRSNTGMMYGESSIGQSLSKPLSKKRLEEIKQEVRNEEDPDAIAIEIDVDEFTPILDKSKLSRESYIYTLRPTVFRKTTRSITDGIDYYTERLIRYTKLFKEARKNYLDSNNYNSNDMYTSSGFITFKSQRSSIIASQVILCSSKNTFAMMCSPAPHYNDVIWDELEIKLSRKTLQGVTLTFFSVILCIFWSIPISFISGLATIDKLGNIEWLQETFPWLVNMENLELLQTFIPPIITNLFLTLVPYIFNYISSFQCIEAYSYREISIMGKYYIFLLFNMLFVFALSNAFFTFISAILESPLSIVYTLGILIPQGATYFINLVTYYPVSLMTSFVMPSKPILYCFNKMISITPRDYYNLKNKTKHAKYGYIIPPSLVIFDIVIIYSIISPIIIFAGLMYFTIGYLVFKHKMLYLFVKEWEYYGRQWVFIHDRIIIGLLILQLTMIGLLIVKGCFLYGLLILPLFIGTFSFYYFCKNTYEKRSIYTPLDQLSPNSSTRHGIVIDNTNIDDNNNSNNETKKIQQIEIKKNEEKIEENDEAKTPGFYEEHTYICPLLTSNLPNLWIPSSAKEVLGDKYIQQIGKLPEQYYHIIEKYNLKEEDLQVPYYFDEKWREK